MSKLKEVIDNPYNVFHYLLGNLRYKLYYSIFRFAIRWHIKEQFEFRIKFMDSICYNQGECKLCGCQTTALQFANKPCDKPCYPRMMNKTQWRNFRYLRSSFVDENGTWFFRPCGNLLILENHKNGTPSVKIINQ